MISVVIPTLNEAKNIPFLVPGLAWELERKGYEYEILIVDDASSDGTAEIARKLAASFPVKVHVRRGVRGLATAVLEGIEMAEGEVCVVMDGDLSHPVDKVVDLVEMVMSGERDIAVGSRYHPEGGFENWPSSRKAVSWFAKVLARGLTTMSDPNTGFMAFRKSILNGVPLDPIGWKIVLEVVCRTQADVGEVPIVFSDRSRGESKLSASVTIQYLRHLSKLYQQKLSGRLAGAVKEIKPAPTKHKENVVPFAPAKARREKQNSNSNLKIG